MSNIVRGTMLLTGASFLSKFLGMIYVIPFNALVGETGGTLFAYAYTPYSIFISISTVGVPLAVSKFVSKYNAVGDYETGMRMFKAGISLMSVTGFLAFLTMFFSADWLAGRMITSDDPVNITVNDVAFVIRMVSVALIVIPAMSIVRGFFQGHNSMGPTAVSQVVEQIIRIVFLLGGAFVILKFMNGTITAAVGFSTFAAFIGAMASCLVLFVYWKKRKTYLNRQIEQQTYTHEIPMKDLFIEIFRYAGPFVLVGLAIPLYQMVDQFTFERAMVAADQKDIWEFAYSAINFYGHKLVIIPITLATGLSLAILPTLTNSYTQQNRQLLNKQINQALQIILVLVIPAVVGMSMLANEAYGSLYGMGKIETTGTLLAWYAPVALLFALFSVSSSILQGINQQKYAVFSLLAGLLIKVLFNIQLIYIFGAKGAIFGTALAAGTAVAMNLWRIRSAIDFSFKEIIKRTMLIGIFILFMCIAILLAKYIFGFFLPFEEQRWAALVMLIIGVGIGGMVYLWFAYKSTLLERVLGEKVRFLDRFLSK
ncbi:cell division protein [Virgibacillus halodenitrificans]|uniref:Cell division protein n=1 Tax=Virgibacillus halodenitrificans TaxID=1482 RepID=A0AAC9IZD2_VIRHA|nr:polysaccharide biosynthesis protein [Virgibacillus halodenitrificans]APC47974.1 cell division protein [Virgibacillus halodenitrificans]